MTKFSSWFVAFIIGTPIGIAIGLPTGWGIGLLTDQFGQAGKTEPSVQTELPGRPPEKDRPQVAEPKKTLDLKETPKFDFPSFVKPKPLPFPETQEEFREYQEKYYFDHKTKKWWREKP